MTSLSPPPKLEPQGGSCGATVVGLLALVAGFVFGLRGLL